MDRAIEKELRLLADGGWDPRMGKGKHFGKMEACFGIVFFAGLIVSIFVKESIIVGVWVYGSLGLIILSWFYIRIWTKKRMIKRVRNNEHFLCVWCNYPLQGLPEFGKCPECGERYRKELCIKLYTLAYERNKLNASDHTMLNVESWMEALKLRDHES